MATDQVLRSGKYNLLCALSYVQLIIRQLASSSFGLLILIVAPLSRMALQKVSPSRFAAKMLSFPGKNKKIMTKMIEIKTSNTKQDRSLLQAPHSILHHLLLSILTSIVQNRLLLNFDFWSSSESPESGLWGTIYGLSGAIESTAARPDHTL